MTYNKAWEVQYARDRAQGRRRYVDAASTRERLRRLTDADVPKRAISRASGLSDTAVANILEGRSSRVQRGTAEKVATLTLSAIYDQARGTVPSLGAQRRVQALMALGWRKQDLEAAGVPSAQLVTRPVPRTQISAEGWQRVREVYDQLSMTPGPSARTRDLARSRRYAPPLAWDEDTIDDPHATPQWGGVNPTAVDEIAVERVTQRQPGPPVQLTPDEQRAAVHILTLRDVSLTETADAVGVSDRTVLRWRQSKGGHGASAADAERLRRATRLAPKLTPGTRTGRAI